MSFLLKISKNTDINNMVKHTPDQIVYETSKVSGEILNCARFNNLEDAVEQFYYMAAFAQNVYLCKNTMPSTIKEARDYADAHEYYVESLKETSTVVEAMIYEKYRELMPKGVVQDMATYASEETKLTKKKIKNHASSFFPVPRKKTNDKRGQK